MPLCGFQLDLFLWQGHGQPVAAQVMSEMQMFEVFAVASQRICLQRGEPDCAVMEERGPPEPLEPKIAVVGSNKGPHTTVLIARRQVREVLLIKMNDFYPNMSAYCQGFYCLP